MQYEKDRKDSINTYYFEAKGRDDDNYKAIVRVYVVNIMLPLAVFIPFMYIAFYHSWIADYVTIYLKENVIPNKSLKEKEKSPKHKEVKGLNSTISGNAKKLSLPEEGKCAFGNDRPHIDCKTNKAALIAASSPPSTEDIIVLKTKAKNTSGSAPSTDDELRPVLQGSNVQSDINMEQEQKEMHYKNRKVNIVALSITFVFLGIALLVFHILASIMLIDYGNAVLYDDNDAHGIHKYGIGDDQCIPIVYTAFSFLPTAILVLYVIVAYCYIVVKFLHDNNKSNEERHISEEEVDNDGCTDEGKLINEKKGNKVQRAAKDLAKEDATDETLGKVFKTSFGCFFVYLGFYFLPYMALAFINDPIEAGFIYLIELSFAFSLFTIIKAAFTYVANDCNFNACDCEVIFITASGLSVAYFLIIFLFILTLGDFYDFKAIENLTLPLVIAVLSFFVLKPAINYVHSKTKK